MRKQIKWTIIIVAICLAVAVCALLCWRFVFQPERVPQRRPFRLAITRSIDASRVGIESGWELDNRAGNLKTDLTGNFVLSDVMTDEKSRLIRHFNRMTEDMIEIRTQLTYGYGFDGNVIELCDADGTPAYRLVNSEGSFCIQNADGSLTKIYTPEEQLTLFTFRIIVDLASGKGTTMINNVSYGEHPLIGDAVKYFAYSTSDETKNVTMVGQSYMFANYSVNENLDLTTGIPCDMEATGSVTNENGLFVFDGSSSLVKNFAPLAGPTVFSLKSYFPEGTSGVSYMISSEGKDIVQLEVKDSKLYANGKELKGLSDKLWHKLRIEADTYSQKAAIKLNGKVIVKVPFLTECKAFDRITLENTGSAKVQSDEIMVYSLVDYDVPEPKIPAGADDYTIGINVCSLWVNGQGQGWSCVTPYKEARPVLGYYDEGIPETADWENKFMAEHGIDFQAFCWYASETNAPMKTTSVSDQLDEAYMHSKYGDKVKFSLIWEAQNGRRPADSEAFRNYYVPYWIENYFSDPRYMVIDNKLMFTIYGAEELIAQFGTALKDDLDYLREEVKKLGFDGMIITASNTWMSELAAYGFDGWQAYNWHKNGYAYTTNVYCNLIAQEEKDVYVIPSISIGFNSIPWDGERTPLMTLEDYQKTHEWVRDEYLPQYSKKDDWTNNFLWLSTWNEYGEGTYIMPADDLYGFGYLDVLRSVYTKGSAKHNDLVPNAEQKTHFNHLYPQDRRILRAYGTYEPPLSEKGGPSLYINERKLDNFFLVKQRQKGKDVWYIPFDPGKSRINFWLYTYHEWDYDTETLKLYRDGKCVTFTAGLDTADVNGKPLELAGKVYLRDNIPMLPIESVAEIFGFTCERKEKDFYLTTPEAEIFAAAENETPGEWNFNQLGDLCGWSSTNASFGFGDGSVMLISNSNDPFMRSRDHLGLKCSEYQKIEIRCRWENTAGRGNSMGFYFTTEENEEGWTQAKSKHIYQSNSSDGEFQTFVYDMSENKEWLGTLKQLRFDPFDAPGTVEIDYIKFIK